MYKYRPAINPLGRDLKLWRRKDIPMQGGFLRLLDGTIGRLFYGVSWIFTLLPKSRKKRILAIKFWALGDTLDMLPALAAIRKGMHDHEITVLCTKNNAAVFELSGIADRIIVLDYGNPINIIKTMVTLAKGFSVCVDFEPFAYMSASFSALTRASKRIGFSSRKILYTESARPQKMHAVHNFMNLARFLVRAHDPTALVKLKVSAKAKSSANNILPKGRIIGIHAGSSSSSKIRRWNENNFAKLADTLASKHNATIAIIGGRLDTQAASKVEKLMKSNPINLAGKIDLETLAACMEKMSLFVANDSGPMHLASAMKVPTIGLFGPNKPELYGPYGRDCIGLYKGPEEPYIKPFEARFPEKYKPEYDVNKITVQEVVRAAAKLLGRGNSRP
ncbi:MAG: glycosyltransferase family 9 protein [Candidatus Aenigmarchaeota archaeon]|nr:glycosyltransferase family 9 protein [Candidatus Aenigmarchaeota archaeon]